MGYRSRSESTRSRLAGGRESGMAKGKGVEVQRRSGCRREDGETGGPARPEVLRFSSQVPPAKFGSKHAAYWFGATLVHQRNDGRVLFSFVLFHLTENLLLEISYTC